MGPFAEMQLPEEVRKGRVGEMNSSGLTRWPLVLRDGQEGKSTWQLDGWTWSLGLGQEVWAGAVRPETFAVIWRGYAQSKAQSPGSGPRMWPS